jgi:Glycosyl transferase family 2
MSCLPISQKDRRNGGSSRRAQRLSSAAPRGCCPTSPNFQESSGGPLRPSGNDRLADRPRPPARRSYGPSRIGNVDASDLIPQNGGEALSVTVVTVSYNTLELTALLLWSLHRVLEWPGLEIVVVDNGSTDGSREMLTEAAEHGLCRLIPSVDNLGHGPGLNLAMDSLRRHDPPPERVWILDSDCVVARGEVLSAVFASRTRAGATIVGETHWDPWIGKHRFELYSLLIDPTLALTTDGDPFTDGGDPAIGFLDASEAAGQCLAPFPFTNEHFIVHRGRGSLASVVEAGDDAHPLYAWAVDHHVPHFGGVKGARERYAGARESLPSRGREAGGAPSR